MLGNDIIDLHYTKLNTDWTRSGWLNKVCTQEEQDDIYKSDNPFLRTWRIWSMKESAYKIAIQKGYRHALNPTKFITSISNDKYGIVHYDNEKIITNTETNKEFIYTIGSEEKSDLALAYSGFVTDLDVLKQSLLIRISNSYSYDHKKLEIRSNKNRVPAVYYANQPLHFYISMSHHGKYGAYTFKKK